MKKRIWIWLLLMLLLTGCSARGQVGICFRDCDDPLTQAYRQELEQTLIDAGYAVTVMDAENDQSQQDRQVKQLVDEKVDILILEPVMTSALDAVLQCSADVPVIFVNREPDSALLQSRNNLCYIGADAMRPGTVQGQMVAALSDGGDLNGDGCVSYVILAGPEDHLDAQLRSDGCEQVLPRGECLAIDYGGWSREDGQRRCAAMLAKFGKDIEVVLCNSDELALGAMEAIVDGGRVTGENIYLYGIGGQRQELFLIRSSDLTGTVALDISTQADNVLGAVKRLMSGAKVEKTTYVDHVPIDQNNVEEYLKE